MAKGPAQSTQIGQRNSGTIAKRVSKCDRESDHDRYAGFNGESEGYNASATADWITVIVTTKST